MKLYCEECVLECYKAGLDVKEEAITKDKDKCSFKHQHFKPSP